MKAYLNKRSDDPTLPMNQAIKSPVGQKWTQDAVSALTDAAQLIDTIKAEWVPTGDWSEWDQSVRDQITQLLQRFYAAEVGPFFECPDCGADLAIQFHWPKCKRAEVGTPIAGQRGK